MPRRAEQGYAPEQAYLGIMSGTAKGCRWTPF